MKTSYAYCNKCGSEFIDTDVDFKLGLRDTTTQWLYCPDCGEESISEYDREEEPQEREA